MPSDSTTRRPPRTSPSPTSTRTRQAIDTNRDAIRLSSSGKLAKDKARRIRRAAYYNLGKLDAVRKFDFLNYNDGPSSCIRIASEPGCAQPVFACAREGATGGAHGGFNHTVARFALKRADARIVEDGELIPGFDSWVAFGDNEAETGDRSNAPWYGVTLRVESELREPSPGEADVTVAAEGSGCDVVHVDACARRLGRYCAWGAWREGATAKPRAKAVELTFSRRAATGDPSSVLMIANPPPRFAWGSRISLRLRRPPLRLPVAAGQPRPTRERTVNEALADRAFAPSPPAGAAIIDVACPPGGSGRPSLPGAVRRSRQAISGAIGSALPVSVVNMLPGAARTGRRQRI